jgi:NAD(P)-dependent dehydrogenase (short-subunit alcohol dehydrogenase family)
MSDYLHDLFGLDDKVAVVVGGTGQLGGAMAYALLQAGAKVLISGRDPQKGQAKLAEWNVGEERASYFSADATIREEVEALLAACLERHGRADLLINGAGGTIPHEFLDISVEEWRAMIALNLESVFHGCQVFGRHWVERQQPASLINISSAGAHHPLSRSLHYSAAKAALLNLTRNLAREWAPRRIRVNAICPGFFPAEQNRKIQTPERVQRIMSLTPMGRFGEPHELAAVTLLLASEVAGSFITGAEYVVDGGFLVTAV